LKDQTPVLLRPIRPEDEPLLVKFHESLSDETVYRRYFNVLKLSQRITHERLTRICFNDYDREIALVAEYRAARGAQPQIIGVGRLSKDRTNGGEFALLVVDQWQKRGLGAELLRRLMQVARDEKLTTFSGLVLRDNQPMQHLCRRLGCKLTSTGDDSVWRAELKL
jgi:acetyltransferase